MKEEIARRNCWEFKQCGREPGGSNVGEFGLCPATTATSYDGTNGGKNGGRICWYVAGTLCKGEIQGSYAKKSHMCLICDFFELVKEEEGIENIVITPDNGK